MPRYTEIMIYTLTAISLTLEFTEMQPEAMKLSDLVSIYKIHDIESPTSYTIHIFRTTFEITDKRSHYLPAPYS